ncbi:MAG: lipopolysaccharide biosynthesis protein [Myxococcota bacterium]
MPDATAEPGSGPGFARRVARSLLLAAAGSVSARVLSLGALLLALRWVSVADLGLASLILAITAVLRATAELSLGGALVQVPTIEPDEIDALFWRSLAAALLAWGIVAGSAPLLASLLSTPELVSPLRIQAAVLVAGSLGMVPRAWLERDLAMGRLALADNIGTIAGAVTLVVMAWQGYGVWAFVGAELVNRSTQTLGLWIAAPYRPRGLGRGASVWPLLRFGLFASGSRLLHHLYINADYLVVGAIVSGEQLGLYAFAYRIVLDPTRGLTNVVVRVAYPTFSRLQDEPERLRRYLGAFARICAGGIGVMLVVCAIMAEGLMTAAGYERWLPALPLVWIFAGLAMLHSVSPLLPQVLYALGRARDGFVYSLSGAVIMPLAFVLGAWWYGVMGVALAWLLVFPVVGFVALSLVARAMALPRRTVLRVLVAGAWLPLPAGLMAWGAAQLLPASPSLLVIVPVTTGLIGLGLAGVLWHERETLRLLRARDDAG